jgi:hypothetical protein
MLKTNKVQIHFGKIQTCMIMFDIKVSEDMLQCIQF